MLHISPSKTDEERMLVAGPELASALAEIIKRVRGSDETVPLVPRYDGYEHEVGEPMPHLFQRQYDADRRVICMEAARALLNRAAAQAALRGPDGDVVRFRPQTSDGSSPPMPNIPACRFTSLPSYSATKAWRRPRSTPPFTQRT